MKTVKKIHLHTSTSIFYDSVSKHPNKLIMY